MDYYTLIATKFVTTGLLNFLLLIAIMAALYSFLRNKKLLGGNPFVDAIVSFSVSFIVFAYPIISGISLVKPVSSFITQGFIIILVFFAGIFAASIFYPNILKFLEETIKSRNILFGMIALSLALFVTSGLVSIIWLGGTTQTSGTSSGGGGQSSTTTSLPEVQILVAGLIIAVVILLMGSYVASRGG